MTNGKLYNFLMLVKGLLTQNVSENSVVSDNNIPESQKCTLECASYDLIKNRGVNKQALEKSSYNLVKRMK